MHTLAIIADTHTNQKTGLNLPSKQLDEGDGWAACKIQKWLFHTFEDCLEQIDKKKQGTLIGCAAGDIVDIDEKDRTLQMVSRNPSVAVEGAQKIIAPFAQMCEKVYFVRGTEAHVGKSGWAEDLVASDFDNAEVCPTTGRKAWWHLPLILDGVTMDISHHPSTNGGGRPMNTQSAIDRLASDTVFKYANSGDKPPALVIRAHVHHYLDSRDAFITRAIICPSFSLLGAYARRLNINEAASVGCVLIYCDRGQYMVEPILYQPKRAQWVKP